MATLEEAPEIIDVLTNIDWSPGNPIIDGNDNEDTIARKTDDKSEHKHSEVVQKIMLLE